MPLTWSHLIQGFYFATFQEFQTVTSVMRMQVDGIPRLGVKMIRSRWEWQYQWWPGHILPTIWFKLTPSFYNSHPPHPHCHWPQHYLMPQNQSYWDQSFHGHWFNVLGLLGLNHNITSTIIWSLGILECLHQGCQWDFFWESVTASTSLTILKMWNSIWSILTSNSSPLNDDKVEKRW